VLLVALVVVFVVVLVEDVVLLVSANATPDIAPSVDNAIATATAPFTAFMESSSP
jgi:hypothetical protein